MEATVVASVIGAVSTLSSAGVAHLLSKKMMRRRLAEVEAERDARAIEASQAHATADAAQASAVTSVAASASALVTPLTEQVARLMAQVGELAGGNQVLREQMSLLQAENIKLKAEVDELRMKLQDYAANERRLITHGCPVIISSNGLTTSDVHSAS